MSETVNIAHAIVWLYTVAFDPLLFVAAIAFGFSLVVIIGRMIDQALNKS